MDEISIDPAKPWLQMGTRQLGDQPWLVDDQNRQSELGLKHQLLAKTGNVVLITANPDAEGAHEAEQETFDLVKAGLAERGLQSDFNRVQDELVASGHIQPTTVLAASALSPLDLSGRVVQEDLCLLQRSDDGWVLRAASLCFPSRWRLSDKVDRPLGAIHNPVPGYESSLQARVDNLLDKLDDQIVWRRNWFIHPDPTLHQPSRPANGDPIVASDRCLEDLYLRSERQTLRKLARSGWCLFTIRTQQSRLGEYLVEDRLEAFLRFLDQSDTSDLDHRGLSAEQVVELEAAIRP